MTIHRVKIFSLAEANSLIPQVARVTGEVVRRLEGIRRQAPAESPGEEELPEVTLKDVEQVLVDWSEQIRELGAQPKGYFTVDFQTVDPELLYCWTYGEEKIEYTHKVWENFSHRRPLLSQREAPADHMKWIN